MSVNLIMMVMSTTSGLGSFVSDDLGFTGLPIKCDTAELMELIVGSIDDICFEDRNLALSVLELYTMSIVSAGSSL